MVYLHIDVSIKHPEVHLTKGSKDLLNSVDKLRCIKDYIPTLISNYCNNREKLSFVVYASKIYVALSIELNTIPLDLRSISAAQALEILFRGSENDRKIKQKVGLNNYLKKIDDCAQVLFINDELRDGYVDSHVELRNSITHRNWSKIEQGTASLDGETGLVKYPEKDTALLLKDYYQTVCLCLAGILCELGIPENNLSSLLMKKITEVKRVIEHLSVAE